MSYKLVVAKYNEDIQWLENMNLSNVIIYDKSNDPIPDAIPRKNIGREAETYFHYIIENYYNLPEYVIFLQGNPFQHMTSEITSQNFQENIDIIIPKCKTNVAVPLFANWYIYPIEPLAASYPAFHFPEYFQLFFGREPPLKRFFAAGAQYITPREVILNKPIKFYTRIYEMIINNKIYDSTHAHNVFEPFCENLINGWALERIMAYIFSEIPINPDFLRGHDLWCAP